MNNVKYWIRGLGIVIFSIGCLCFPFPIVGPNQKSGMWPYVTATGAFIKYGLIFSGIGLIIILISLLIPKK